MGSETVTIKNKKIVGINDNLLLISGPIPGSNGDLVKIYLQE
jgi:ribosomal protein L3